MPHKTYINLLLSHLATALSDASSRMFLYHSNLTQAMMEEILPEVHSIIPEFVTAIKKPFTDGDMLANSRGLHWFSIAGHDRNNKEVSFMSSFPDTQTNNAPGVATQGNHIPARQQGRY